MKARAGFDRASRQPLGNVGIDLDAPKAGRVLVKVCGRSGFPASDRQGRNEPASSIIAMIARFRVYRGATPLST